MSRIGKTPVLIPEKVTVDFDGLIVTVKGPKGELKRIMPEGVSFDKKDNTVVLLQPKYIQGRDMVYVEP